ncbi:PhnD/SsuA/transferrin family substrate-binding protein [Vibrio sp. FNV 38]|nr:PhnD/SsuA/transferrin family substrate-binding protein [Vibrio sp. FNV 38]
MKKQRLTILFSGLVDVAAISNKDWINPRKFPTHIRDELKIVHQLAPIPRAVTLFRQNINPIVKSQLVKALTNAHNDPNSFEALRAFKKTSQFTRLTEDEIQMIRDIKSQYHSILALIE